MNTQTETRPPLAEKELQRIDAELRAANGLSVGQTYRLDTRC